MSGEILARNAMLAAMKGGKPYKTYKKTILGKVFIEVWDNFINGPVGILLSGDPKKDDPDCYYHAWTEDNDVFFRGVAHNRRHLEQGAIIPVKYEQKEIEKTIETSSDEELTKLVNSPFLALQNALNKTESVALLFRVLTIAQELEKSEKITRAIEARLSEVQEAEFNPQATIEG